MSNSPKRISVRHRESAAASRLRTKGERVSYVKNGHELLGFLLDGKLYRSPGISNRGTRVWGDVKVFRDGGKRYDSL